MKVDNIENENSFNLYDWVTYLTTCPVALSPSTLEVTLLFITPHYIPQLFSITYVDLYLHPVHFNCHTNTQSYKIINNFKLWVQIKATSAPTIIQAFCGQFNLYSSPHGSLATILVVVGAAYIVFCEFTRVPGSVYKSASAHVCKCSNYTQNNN